jgi:hypothetical protein
VSGRKLRGACSTEGLTFLPLVQQAKNAGVHDRDTLRSLTREEPDSANIVRRMSDPLGFSDETVSLPEIFWAARRFYETIAAVEPLSVAFEGFDDADPVLYDMLEYLQRALNANVTIDRVTGRGDPRPPADPAAEGRRALDRGDLPAAAYLLERAVTLQPDAGLHLDLAEALIELGDLDGADDHCRAAERLGHKRSRIVHLTVRARRGEGLEQGELEDALEGADDAGAARVLELLADVRWTHGEYTAAGGLLMRSFEHARDAGARRDLARVGAWLFTWMYLGSIRVPDAIARCEAMAEATSVDPLLDARRLAVLGGLHGMSRDFGRARVLLAEARSLQREFGQPPVLGGVPQIAGEVELWAGDPMAAERAFREAYDRIEVVGDPGHLSATRASVARSLWAQGRIDDAERTIADLDDRTAGSVRALIRASRGDPQRAVVAAQAAVEVTDPAEEPVARSSALVDLVRVLRACGFPYEEEMREARALLERKGIAVNLP